MALAPLLGDEQVELVSTSPTGYDTSVSQGSVALSRDSEAVPIRILRDTRTAQALLLESAIDFPPLASPRRVVLLAGLGGKFGAVPLREVHLTSDLVSGPVTVGVVLSLPIGGISLLGNDLAGDQMRVSPVVSSEPCDVVGLVELERELPKVFPACVVTRAKACLRADVTVYCRSCGACQWVGKSWHAPLPAPLNPLCLTSNSGLCGPFTQD